MLYWAERQSAIKHRRLVVVRAARHGGRAARDEPRAAQLRARRARQPASARRAAGAEPRRALARRPTRRPSMREGTRVSTRRARDRRHRQPEAEPGRRARASRCSRSATSRSRSPHRAASVKAVQHVDLTLAPGRDRRPRRRERLGQVDAGARRLPAAAPARGDHRRQRHLPRQPRRRRTGVELLEQTRTQLRTAALARDLDRLPERDERAEPGAAGRATSSATRIDAHLDLGARRSGSGSASCSTSSGSRASGCAATRTSSPAACASG